MLLYQHVDNATSNSICGLTSHHRYVIIRQIDDLVSVEKKNYAINTSLNIVDRKTRWCVREILIV